ncbi:MAG TPA: hypothetical protein VFU21_00625, partial [Kofleriaceae bacterium]|nr:hypothetical protein [Kofleriaceae bacterium]
MTRSSLSLVFAAAALCAAAPLARAGAVRHVPVAEAEAGAALTVPAEVERGFEATVTLHYRPVLGTAWKTAEFQRQGDDWTATIPAGAVTAPGVDYFIDVRGPDGRTQAVFASQAAPHRISVRRSAGEVRKERELARAGGRRSRFSTMAEWVDFGTRTYRKDGMERDIPDRYYRIDASYTYLLLAYPLKAFRIGGLRLLGTSPEATRGDGEECPGTLADCDVEAGFKVGGYAELRFALQEGIELDARGTFMATKEGFNVGGRGELRFGVEDGSHVAMGGELLADVGSSAFFRLGWDTVPGLPMTAAVEVLDYPA